MPAYILESPVFAAAPGHCSFRICLNHSVDEDGHGAAKQPDAAARALAVVAFVRTLRLRRVAWAYCCLAFGWPAALAVVTSQGRPEAMVGVMGANQALKPNTLLTPEADFRFYSVCKSTQSSARREVQHGVWRAVQFWKNVFQPRRQARRLGVAAQMPIDRQHGTQKARCLPALLSDRGMYALQRSGPSPRLPLGCSACRKPTKLGAAPS